MPLPEATNLPWPPPELKDVFRQVHTWSTWYGGDPEEIARLYGGNTSASTYSNHPTQFAGGVVGTLARMWWGQPIPAGEQRAKMHIPLASDIATKSADLLYSEPPTFVFDKGNEAATKRVDALVEEGLYATLLEGAELGAAKSGYYQRIVWDKNLKPLPWLSIVQADAAVPEWRWGMLVAVTFWTVVQRDDKGKDVLRHLERHEPGHIYHGLYQGTDTELGRRISLRSSSATAHYASVTEDGEVFDDVRDIPTGVQGLTAAYVPNIRPAPLWLDNPLAAPMGRSDYTPGVIGLFDALDETWSSWMRDIRLAKMRLLVPGDYLKNLGPGQGAGWSAEQEVFTSLNMLPASDGRPQITANQFDIRVAEHEQSARAITAQAVTSAGYSAQSFGLSSDVAITATEVSARERQSYITRDKKIVYQRTPISGLIETLMQIEALSFADELRALYKAVPKPERPRMEFADGVSDSTETTARTLQLIEAARAASTQTKVQMLHPDWEQEDVDQEVTRILDEDGATTRDPEAFLNDAAAGKASGEPAADPDEDAGA